MTTILKKYTLEIGQRCQHRMAIAIEINEECPVQEVSSVIKSALLRDTRVASYKEKRYTGICKRFEKKYETGSDEFVDKLESGMLDDKDD